MDKSEKRIEVIECEAYGLESFLNDVIKCDSSTMQRDTQTDGEKIYKYIKENM